MVRVRDCEGNGLVGLHEWQHSRCFFTLAMVIIVQLIDGDACEPAASSVLADPMAAAAMAVFLAVRLP